MIAKEEENLIQNSNYISRDLSWMAFNLRVLDQVQQPTRSIYDKLKFLSITASNLDEFFMIRVGSLYNYLDYGKQRTDYSGLREKPFRNRLFKEAQECFYIQQQLYKGLIPHFQKNGFAILPIDQLRPEEQEEVAKYFANTIIHKLTPMAYDAYRTFPILSNKTLIFGVETLNGDNGKSEHKISFVPIPQKANLPRFYEIERDDMRIFIPIEEIVRWKIHKLYRNVEILSTSLFRITRNGDFTLEESEDMEEDFINEVKRKLNSRKTGRVVRIEVEPNFSQWTLKILTERWRKLGQEIDELNIFKAENLLDFTGLFQIAFHKEFREHTFQAPETAFPIGLKSQEVNLFEYLKHQDLMLHHPYNSMETLVRFVEEAAEDPQVLSIKMTLYRLADDSRIAAALEKAAENDKHVSVLIELKARFDEKNNIEQAERLQKAGCYVVHGVSRMKAHAKMMLIVRKEENEVVRYVHMSSGNYNEKTARLYTDTGLLTSQEAYADEVAEFFNAMTGHSKPLRYDNLITYPRDMRQELMKLVRNEARNAQAGLNSGIIIKVNSLQDREFIDALYEASQAGVPIQLIIRGICCLRPQRAKLSENIMVRSIVGEFLEHPRIFFFQNDDQPNIYAGSADAMVRSFDRRIECLFAINSPNVKQQLMTILHYNLLDNVNTYLMNEDGTYSKRSPQKDENPFNIHQEFFHLYRHQALPKDIKLFLPPIQHPQALAPQPNFDPVLKEEIASEE